MPLEDKDPYSARSIDKTGHAKSGANNSAKQDHKRLGEGGAKDRGSSIESRKSDPALQKESRQAVKNQGKANPQDYPDRSANSV